jgi:hypothetical protein
MSTPRRRRSDRAPLNQVVGTPATVPTATGAIPNPVDSLAREPTHDEIARRAYHLYEKRGGNAAASGRTGSRRNASCDCSRSMTSPTGSWRRRGRMLPLEPIGYREW